MSAGAFELTRYTTNAGEIQPIRVQPETLSFEINGTANAAPAGDITVDQLVKVSRSNGEYGVRPRKVSIRFTAAPPTGYKADQTYEIPVLQEALWESASRTTPVTYLGIAGQVVSKSSESIR